MKLLALLFAIQLCLIVSQSIQLRNMKKTVNTIHRKFLSYSQKNEALVHNMYLSLESLTQGRSLPASLLHIPLADESGIILSVKKIEFPCPSTPYNGSIGLINNSYHLVFRYDTPSPADPLRPFSSHIAAIELDKDFNPLKDTFYTIPTDSPFSEDARFFQSEGRPFLVYNDLLPNSTNRRGIRIGAMNLEKKQLDYITSFELNLLKIEKNWTPFAHQGAIHFLYSIDPQKVLSLPDPEKNRLHSSSIPSKSALDWSNRWGTLRGGTPALLVDGEYLSFFHSSFEDQKGILWYVMGAYTFAASSPFQITRISTHPLLFKGIYDTPHQEMANSRVRSIYPVGFISERRDGKDVISVSCGENDSGIKILTLDKEALFSSLKAVSSSR